jgi:hypothetical protein
MLNFIYANGKLTAVTTDYVRDAVNRNDFKSLADAERVASDATTLTGDLYVAADRGGYTSPRYDVVEAPVVGAKVSRSFNGDSYPAGTIIKVSDSLKRVQTDDGTVFYRVGNTDSWRNNRTWFMAYGHHNERNPSF